MLDHEHRAALRDPLDEGDDAAHVLVAHPLRRLVEEHHLRVERERRRELERALAAVGQLDRHGVAVVLEPDRREQLHRAAVERGEAALRAPEVEGRPELPLQRHPDVLERGERREHRGHLERADHPAAGDVRRPRVRDVLAPEPDLAAGHGHEAGQQVEDGGLARPVRPDERVDRPARDAQRHPVHRHELVELLHEPAGLEDTLLVHRASAPESPKDSGGGEAWREPAHDPPNGTPPRGPEDPAARPARAT